ncbi:hypothetical protein PN462_09675 [Spirulina sp. CS-785/01]|nr:hypothetical protein [Spirulina sp. CS-785/01]MDB9313367.1 hypothetical protein [Spirulina sp. CS-785/01]
MRVKYRNIAKTRSQFWVIVVKRDRSNHCYTKKRRSLEKDNAARRVF